MKIFVILSILMFIVWYYTFKKDLQRIHFPAAKVEIIRNTNKQKKEPHNHLLNKQLCSKLYDV